MRLRSMVLLSLLLLVLIIALAITVHASPFLVCDPYPETATQPEWFVTNLDGGGDNEQLPQDTPEGKRIHADLQYVTDGQHTMTVKACNVWGCSTSTPFLFTRQIPDGLSGLGLER